MSEYVADGKNIQTARLNKVISKQETWKYIANCKGNPTHQVNAHICSPYGQH